MSALRSPRFWLMLWGVAGALALLYVIIAASAKPEAQKAAARTVHDPALVVGEIAKFQFAMAATAAPDVPFFTNGRPQFLNDRRGKVLLVNLWATWCKPCLEELPSLDALQRAKGGADFEVVAIAADPQGEARVRAYLARLGVSALDVHMDPALRLTTAFGAGAGLPLSVLYDRKGQEIGRLRGGADWSSQEAKALIDAAINTR